MKARRLLGQYAAPRAPASHATPVVHARHHTRPGIAGAAATASFTTTRAHLLEPRLSRNTKPGLRAIDQGFREGAGRSFGQQPFVGELLEGTEQRLDALLRDFRWGRMDDIFLPDASAGRTTAAN